MSKIDIALIIIFLIGAFSGYRKGFLSELFSLLGIILGILAGFKLMGSAMLMLDENYKVDEKVLPYVAFGVVFIIVVIIVSLFGKLLKSSLEKTVLGNADQVAGSMLGILKAAFRGALTRQYQGQKVDFSVAGLDGETQVPKALFEGVADNLLQNAIAKRAGGTPVRIQVTVKGGAYPELRVCDSGTAATPEVVSALFRAPVRSSAGLGIGLYQAARHAEASGYALSLAENRDGEVCFVLSSAAAGPAA